jgi:hypothetical protein
MRVEISKDEKKVVGLRVGENVGEMVGREEVGKGVGRPTFAVGCGVVGKREGE